MQNPLRQYGKITNHHKHDDFHQVIIPQYGLMELDVNGKEAIVNQECCAIVTSGEWHSFSSQSQNRFIVLDINQNNQPDHLAPLWEKALNTPILPLTGQLKTAVNFANNNFHNQIENYDFDRWQKLFLLTLKEETRNANQKISDRLLKVTNHIHNYYKLPITNKELADIACLSLPHFYSLFKKTFDETPQEYIAKHRIHVAKSLIKSGYRLIDVSQIVGFSDQSTFGRAFKRQHGISPNQWRQQQTLNQKS